MGDTAVKQPPAGDTPAKATPTELSTETPAEPPVPQSESLPPVEVALNKEYECGYCFTKCPYMEDPRKLPLCDLCCLLRQHSESSCQFLLPRLHVSVCCLCLFDFGRVVSRLSDFVSCNYNN